MSPTGNVALNLPGDRSRREFLKAGSIGAVGLCLGRIPGATSLTGERAVILLTMAGGPSQLETFDPKPDAPAEIRGPFGSIATALPGVRVNEFMPKIARRMNRLTLIRSLHHHEAPVHETGLQLLQTGRVCGLDREHPHFGSVASNVLGSSSGAPAFVMLPGPLKKTGINISQGQTAGPLGRAYEPTILESSSHHRNLCREPGAVREAYGPSEFGENCLIARRLVEAGSRVVVVNMCRGVFDETSWDCHGHGPFSTLDDYRRVLSPTFDAAFSALIDDLDRVGRLETTLVIATGEFGRSPRLNSRGGRDHWPGVWSGLLAGAGTAGGQVIGSSDAQGAEPSDNPIALPELVAITYRHLRIEKSPTIRSSGRSIVADLGVDPIDALA